MIEQARGQLGGLSIPKKPLSRQEDLESSSTSHREAEDVIQYKQGAAEGLSFLDNDSVDFISAGLYTSKVQISSELISGQVRLFIGLTILGFGKKWPGSCGQEVRRRFG